VDLEIVNRIPTVTSIGQPGTNYVLERTLQLAPLASWTMVSSTNAPASGRFTLVDQAALGGGAQQSFYRMRW